MTLRKAPVPILFLQEAEAGKLADNGQLTANAAEGCCDEFDDLPSQQVRAEIVDLLRKIDVE